MTAEVGTSNVHFAVQPLMSGPWLVMARFAMKPLVHVWKV
jgi:hypothetical protein